MSEIFGIGIMGGGSGSGGTLTVTGVAGHTVTATKDGKTYTRTFNSSGVAVFKGLSTGTWTLTMTGDGQTATRTVDVTADYAVTITYFSATINVTYPSGSTCKATHTDGTVLNAPDTSGTWACVVPKSGTWTILAEDTSAGKSKSVEVSITAEGQSESVTLSYADYIFSAGTGAVKAMTNVNSANQSILIETDSIVWSWNGDEESSSCVAYTSETIDLTNYKKIFVRSTMSAVYPSVEQYRAKLAICASLPNKDANISAWAAYVALNTDTNATVALDISNISGSYYVALQGARSNGSVYDIWLE